MSGSVLVCALLFSFIQDGRGPGVNPSTPVRRPGTATGQAPRPEPSAWRWLADPRSAVLLVLASATLIGGGRKVLKTLEARKIAARLAEDDVTVEEIARAGAVGREGLLDLFRLLGTAEDADRRFAAGRAIARLWRDDDLIGEEEKALVRRGYVVDWKARRRYPRGLTVPIPITVHFGVPFLRDEPEEVGTADLAWSYRITGTERASLEEFTPWARGPAVAVFEINPTDYASNGPHRLVFQAKVSTNSGEITGEKPGQRKTLTDPWQIELPHVPFSFELDPLLQVDALLTLPDEARAEVFARAVRLRDIQTPDGQTNPTRFVPIANEFLFRDPPEVNIVVPLPCDLAHDVTIEFEGLDAMLDGGEVVVSGQGVGTMGGIRTVPLNILGQLPSGAVERPGEMRIRARLTPNPAKGWADPDVRSIWPGTIVTDWATVKVVRR